MKRAARPSADLPALADRLKVLADPTRLAILDLLMEGVQCNCYLGDRLGLTMNLISHHLKVLREAGWVNVERDPLDARWMYYSVNQEKVIELRELVSAFLDHNASNLGCRRAAHNSLIRKPPALRADKRRSHHVPDADSCVPILQTELNYS